MRVICKMSALSSHYNLSSYTFPGSFVSLLLDEEEGSENAQLPIPALTMKNTTRREVHLYFQLFSLFMLMLRAGEQS